VPTTINEEGIEVAGAGPQPNYLKGAHVHPKLAVNAAKPVQANGKAAQGDLSSFWGQQIPFNQIVAYGALTLSGSAFVQQNGYTEGWDNCSDTPFLYDTSRTTVV
jgi:chitinase